MDAKRRQILDAALAIADERGLDAVSMRSVAARVGLTPMALYPYVGSKGALLDGIVDRLMATLPRLPSDVDWRERLLAMAQGARDLARAHPAAFPLLLARPSVTPDAARTVDGVYGALLEAGVAPQHVARLERMISTFVLGFAISEVNGRFGSTTVNPRTTRMETFPGELDAHRTLAEHLAETPDWDAEFLADLEDLTRVIEARTLSDRD